MGLEIEEIGSASRWDSLREEWESLHSASEEGDIFTSFDWLRTWWDVYGEGRRLCIYAARENDQLVGLAPFAIGSIGKLMRFRIKEYVGTGSSDRLANLALPGREDVHREIWKRLIKEGGFDIIDLKDMLAMGTTASTLRRAFPSAEVEMSPSPYIPLEGSYEVYLKGLSSNFRHSYVSSWKLLREELSARVEVLTRPEDMPRGFELLTALNAMRWEGREPSTLSSVKMREFLEAAVTKASPKGQVSFHVLMTGETPISVILGFRFRRRYLYYLSGFDPEFRKYGPGRTLIMKIIEGAFTEGLTEVDLLRGGEDYKYRFKPRDRPLLRLRAKGKGFRGSLSDVVKR